MIIRRKIWFKIKRNHTILITIVVISLVSYFVFSENGTIRENFTLSRRSIENSIQEALKYDKSTGCDIPRLDPFAPEVMEFDKKLPQIVCEGKDWVKCYRSHCKVVPAIIKQFEDITCQYTDIIFETDFTQKLGKVTEVVGADVYKLNESDHVAIKCTGRENNDFLSTSWSGYGTGFRPITPKPAPPGRENTYNVLIFGYDTTAKNGFIRKMPKSYKYLTEKVKATVLNGFVPFKLDEVRSLRNVKLTNLICSYNIVGDGTPAALFPILTGKTELELPDVRKVTNKDTIDSFPFIFYKVKEDGYRTAFFEDSPFIGTFQYRFNGWKKQPTDHYIRPLYLEKEKNEMSWFGTSNNGHCIGDTPSYKIMMNSTEQFMSLPGKKFIFNFIVDITHDDFNKIQTADEDTVLFLSNFMNSELKENTLLIVMGDHGPRFADVRKTLQGKLEERLPLMAIRLPDRLVADRPDALNSLLHNTQVLTTPHDLHATILDTIDMRQFWNPFEVVGTDLPRALTMLQPIPKSRSCSEAGVEPHWCACLSWTNVSSSDPLYQKAANKLIEFINEQTEPVRSRCSLRTLTSIESVTVHRVRDKVAEFVQNRDIDGYTGRFVKTDQVPTTVQVKLTVAPGGGMYEASMTHLKSTDELVVNPREISRINAYGHEPDCVSATHPHLNPYCYCN